MMGIREHSRPGRPDRLILHRNTRTDNGATIRRKSLLTSPPAVAKPLPLYGPHGPRMAIEVRDDTARARSCCDNAPRGEPGRRLLAVEPRADSQDPGSKTHVGGG